VATEPAGTKRVRDVSSFDESSFSSDSGLQESPPKSIKISSDESPTSNGTGGS
jgi:hypothetical protein